MLTGNFRLKMKQVNECPICLEDNYDKYSSKLKCGHTLCSICLINYAIISSKNLKQKIECPLCRYVILDVNDNINDNVNDNVNDIYIFKSILIITSCVIILIIYTIIYLLKIYFLDKV